MEYMDFGKKLDVLITEVKKTIKSEIQQRIVADGVAIIGDGIDGAMLEKNGYDNISDTAYTEPVFIVKATIKDNKVVLFDNEDEEYDLKDFDIYSLIGLYNTIIGKPEG